MAPSSPLVEKIAKLQSWKKENPPDNFPDLSTYCWALREVDPSGILSKVEGKLDSYSERELEVIEFLSRDYVFKIFTENEFYA